MTTTQESRNYSPAEWFGPDNVWQVPRMDEPTITAHCPFPPDAFAAAVGGPVPAWVVDGVEPKLPTAGRLVAAEVAHDRWSAVLTVELAEVE